MNSNQPFDNDESLRKLLREWRADAPLPPRFQEQVWERVAKAETRSASSWGMLTWRWMETTLSRSAFAMTYMVVLLLFGVSAGCQQGEAEAAHAKSELQARYVQMVDPYQTPR